MPGCGKAIDVHDKGGQHGRGDGADAGDGVEVVGLGQRAIRRNQQGFQAFLSRSAVTQLTDLVAYQLVDGRARQ